MIKNISIAILFVFIAGCAQIQQYEHLSKSIDATHSASLGSELYRIKKTRDLPNVFGKADIWGGKINEGYNELRFMGFTPNGEIIFRLTDIDIESNESVFTRYGASHSVINSNTRSNATSNVTANATFYGNTAHGTARATSHGTSNTRTTVAHYDKPEATITKLPPNTVEFVFNPDDGSLTLGNITIEILEVKTYSIIYVLHKQ